MFTEIQKKKYFNSLTPSHPDWFLYHSYKNKEWLPFTFFISILFLVFGIGGVVADIVIWSGYIYYCFENNWKLENDPVILMKRYKAMKRFIDNLEKEERRKNDNI